jgi:hypothetical protein
VRKTTDRHHLFARSNERALPVRWKGDAEAGAGQRGLRPLDGFPPLLADRSL